MTLETETICCYLYGLIPALGADVLSLKSTWKKGGRDELERRDEVTQRRQESAMGSPLFGKHAQRLMVPNGACN